MKRLILYFIVLIAVVFMGSACIIAYIDSPGSRGLMSGEEYYESVEFPSGGVLSLSNFDGNIEILGWGDKMVEIYADRMPDMPSGRDVKVMPIGRDFVPDIDLEHSEDQLKINTRAANKGGDNCRADYYIKVPHDINLHDILARDGDITIADLYGSVFIELRTGNVTVDNFSGSLTSNVIQGSITATIYDLREEDNINLKCDQGDITILLQPDVNAQIEAYFPGGMIESAFDLAAEPEDNRINAQIGEKGANIYITALEGNVIIKKNTSLK